MRFRIPHTLVLLAAMVVVAWLLTFILPAGAYDRVPSEGGKLMVVPGTFKLIGPAPGEEPPGFLARLTSVFLVIPRGFSAAGHIIFFVFIIGGAFSVLRKTGAIDALLAWVLRTFGHKPALLIAAGMLAFAAGSSTLGMAEEYLPFVPVLLALAAGLALDPVVGVGIVCVGYSVGYGTAAINPFTVIIAQNVAGLEQTSGLWYRLVLTVPFFALGYFHVLRYARRIQKDSSLRLVLEDEDTVQLVKPEASVTSAQFTGTHILCLLATLITIGALVWGIAKYEWYLDEMGGLFLALALVLVLLARMGLDTAAKAFCEGAAELTTTALLIGFARSIELVLDDGKVIDTIIHSVAVPLEQAGPAIAACGMFLVQSLTNLFIPSGSGQALVTMPIMTPLADLVGVERQVAVLAYQFGDGFTNILVPTNAVLMGILAMARVPYDRWLRFILPFMLQVWILGSIALCVAVWIGYK